MNMKLRKYSKPEIKGIAALEQHPLLADTFTIGFGAKQGRDDDNVWDEE